MIYSKRKYKKKVRGSKTRKKNEYIEMIKPKRNKRRKKKVRKSYKDLQFSLVKV